MTQPGASNLDVLARASDTLERLCASLDEDKWDLPTPCSEWDLGQLVDHVTGGNWFTVEILGGEQADTAIASTMARFGGESSRPDVAISSSRAQLDAFGQPGALDRRCQHVSTELSGAEVLRLRLHDIIIHTWDIAQTISPPASIPYDLASWALADLAMPDLLAPRHFGLDASDLDRQPEEPQAALLAVFGRSA